MAIRRSFRNESGALYRYPARAPNPRRPVDRELCAVCESLEPLYEGTICQRCYDEMGVGA